MSILKFISRILIGLLFTFSGFVKAVDPKGGAIKISEYLEIVGIHNLGSIALILSILLAAFEFIVGFSLLFKSKAKTASILALLFMGFFTILTLYSAVYNPVTDCGCFGDAIKLDNWQTFYKNLISLPFAILLVVKRKELSARISSFKQVVVVALGMLFILSISYYGIKNLPMFDFRPYKIGTNIQEGMRIPEGAAQPEYKTEFILKKDGQTKIFDEHNYPYEDTTWVFVDSKTTLIKEGYQPPIHNFMLESTDGQNLTEYILNHDQPVFLMIAPKLEKAHTKNFSQFIDIQHICMQNNFLFYGVTASLNEDISDFDIRNNAGFTYLIGDETLLKTITRGNPGLVILYKGTIIAKYNYNSLPPIGQLKNPVGASLKALNHSKSSLLLSIWSIVLGACLIFIYKL